MRGVPSGAATAACYALFLSALLGSPAEASADSGAADIAKLNKQRTTHGIPGIVHVPEWSRWCDLHISYMQANGGVLTHEEVPGQAGFTAEGKQAGENSVLSRGAWDDENPWETAPIHLHQLLAPRLDAAGIADRDGYVCATTLLSRNRAPAAANVVYTYPGSGTRHRYEEVAAEDPYTPGQRVGLPAGARTGPYIYVMPDGPALDPFSDARITSATLRGPAGPVRLRWVDNFTSGLSGFIPTGGQLIPESPLEPQTNYTANVVLVVSPSTGAAPITFARQWSFTTVTGRSPGLRVVRITRRGRLLSVRLRTRRGARGRARLRIRRCVRARGRTRCNRRHRLRVRRTRRGTGHRLSVRLPRAGIWSVRPQFDGTGDWGDQRLRAFRVRAP